MDILLYKTIIYICVETCVFINYVIVHISLSQYLCCRLEIQI